MMGEITIAVVKNIISRLGFPIEIIDKFSLSTLHEILKQKMVKGSATKANKDCQILLFDVHVVHKTPKTSFLRCISEGDGKQVAKSVHSSAHFLYSTFMAIVLAIPTATAVLIS